MIGPLASTSSAENPLRILLLRDRRPGHFNQVEGVAAAISRLTGVSVARHELRSRPWARGDLRHAAFKLLGNRSAWLIQSLYELRPAHLGEADVVVASGRMSFPAASLIARERKAIFICSGYVGGYDPRHVDLMLVSSPRLAGEPKCVLAPVPSLVDPDRLPPAKPLQAPEDLAGAEIRLLLGGPSRTHRYRSEDWDALVALVSRTAGEFGIRWRVATSRRTPPLAAARMTSLLSRGVIAASTEYSAAGPASPEALFAADAVVVTEDSVSMIGEAMASHRPVVALCPAGAGSSEETEAISAWAAARRMAVVPLANPDRFAEALLSVQPSPTDHRDLLAEALAPVLGLTPPALGSAGRGC